MTLVYDEAYHMAGTYVPPNILTISGWINFLIILRDQICVFVLRFHRLSYSHYRSLGFTYDLGFYNKTTQYCWKCNVISIQKKILTFTQLTDWSSWQENFYRTLLYNLEKNVFKNRTRRENLFWWVTNPITTKII